MTKAKRPATPPKPAPKTARKAAASHSKPAAARVVAGSPNARHVRELIHELQVYSEEITVQNEQLLKAQSELEEARDRFADLYDFAPIGYLSLDENGIITEINLSGAAL